MSSGREYNGYNPINVYNHPEKGRIKNRIILENSWDDGDAAWRIYKLK
jgi:hypothetical protein